MGTPADSEDPEASEYSEAKMAAAVSVSPPSVSASLYSPRGYSEDSVSTADSVFSVSKTEAEESESPISASVNSHPVSSEVPATSASSEY